MLFEGEELSLTRLTLSPGCATAAVALAAEARRGYFAVRCGDSIHLGPWLGAEWEVKDIHPLTPVTYDPDVVTSGDGSQALFVWAEADGKRHIHKSLLFADY